MIPLLWLIGCCNVRSLIWASRDYSWSKTWFAWSVLSCLSYCSCPSYSLVALTWSLHSRAEYFHACSFCTLVKDFQKNSGLTKLCSYWTQKMFSLCLQWELYSRAWWCWKAHANWLCRWSRCCGLKEPHVSWQQQYFGRLLRKLAWEVALSRSVVQGVGKTAQCN